MSIHVMSWVLKHSPEKLAARLVLIVLADHAKDDGTGAWPEVDTIAAQARVDRRTAQRCLRQLEASKAIVATGKSRAGTVVYTVKMGRQNVAPGAATAPSEGGTAPPDPSEDHPSAPQDDAQRVVAAYVDMQRARDVEPPRRLVGHIARQVGELLGEGQKPDVVRRALELLIERELNPGALPSLIPEASRGGRGRARPQAKPIAEILDLPEVTADEKKAGLAKVRELFERATPKDAA